ncbi:MAG: hypothetical protein IPJ82_14390 [Lewinellaceae bacterium]|nr:hypothetical protein [Lewinellaceae bacterium]
MPNFPVQTIGVKPVSCQKPATEKLLYQASNGAPPYRFGRRRSVCANVPASVDQTTGLSPGRSLFCYGIRMPQVVTAVSGSFIVEEAPPLFISGPFEGRYVV